MAYGGYIHATDRTSAKSRGNINRQIRAKMLPCCFVPSRAADVVTVKVHGAAEPLQSTASTLVLSTVLSAACLRLRGGGFMSQTHGRCLTQSHLQSETGQRRGDTSK